jgi:hypothetical protein
MIEKRGKFWVVKSHTTGRSFGKYLSRRKAVERLKQIQMFSNLKPIRR